MGKSMRRKKAQHKRRALAKVELAAKSPNANEVIEAMRMCAKYHRNHILALRDAIIRIGDIHKLTEFAGINARMDRGPLEDFVVEYGDPFSTSRYIRTMRENRCNYEKMIPALIQQTAAAKSPEDIYHVVKAVKSGRMAIDDHLMLNMETVLKLLGGYKPDRRGTETGRAVGGQQAVGRAVR